MTQSPTGGMESTPDGTCSWCKKPASDVDILLVMSGEDTAICDECVSICSEIINEELKARAKKDKP